MNLYFVIAVVFAVVASIIAHSKGRNSLGWFISGLFIGPFALIVTALPPVPREGRFERCPLCGEVIQADARLCRYCGREIEPLAGRAP